ncbi:MAG: MFS transporter [Proteobacteria bacterium]|uniref:MFS transporter n=1 Tax=Candidatus Avisuccinivibrio stercorigallinarum TaxID=2840704 RepID=A0A9D9DCK7_9GAMM|nr:MFS transporter [Candidatus Avisuccinivibrio stercorigallinarum]
MQEKRKLTAALIYERFCYGCGDFGCNIIYTAMSAFLLFYYTDYAGVSAAAVGTIMLISRVFDGLSDLVMGVIVDRTRSKYGKARVWLLRCCVPFALSGILLFSVPVSWSDGAKLVYVFITYNLTSTVVYTAINVPYSSLNALMTQDPYERSVLSIFRNLLATAGTLLINIATLPLVEYFGDNPLAWTKTFAVFGILAVIAFLLTFFGTKERVRAVADLTGTAVKLPFIDGLKSLFANKYWIMMASVLALFFLYYAINGGSTVYYAQEILGDRDLVGTINGIYNAIQIAAMFFIAMLVKRYGKRNVFCIGLVLVTIGLLILEFGQGSQASIIISSIVRGIGNACGGATMWAMVSDTIDYGEWKTGHRTEGLVNSACSFGYKIGNGIGSALLGIIIELGGYVGGAAVQSSSALFSIRLCFTWIPIGLFAACGAILFFYHLDKEFSGIISDLHSRAAKAEKQARS